MADILPLHAIARLDLAEIDPKLYPIGLYGVGIEVEAALAFRV